MGGFLCALSHEQVGDPTMDNHPSCAYSKLDFDGQTEHSVFFSSECCNSLKSVVCLVSPLPAGLVLYNDILFFVSLFADRVQVGPVPDSDQADAAYPTSQQRRGAAGRDDHDTVAAVPAAARPTAVPGKFRWWCWRWR